MVSSSSASVALTYVLDNDPGIRVVVSRLAWRDRSH